MVTCTSHALQFAKHGAQHTICDAQQATLGLVHDQVKCFYVSSMLPIVIYFCCDCSGILASLLALCKHVQVLESNGTGYKVRAVLLDVAVHSHRHAYA